MSIKLENNNLDRLDEAIDASFKVFKPSTEEKIKYHNKQDWLNKINDGGLLVTAKDEKQIIGFSICYSNTDKLHIWNVGVLKDYRKHGVWKMMYQEIVKFAKEKEFSSLTLNTYKAKFPGMYAFCEKNGFKEFKTENEKSFFIKEI